MTDNTAQSNPAAITVCREDLALELRVGENVLRFQMTPRAALQLARDLTIAGLEHVDLHAEARIAMQELPEAAARKAIQ